MILRCSRQSWQSWHKCGEINQKQQYTDRRFKASATQTVSNSNSVRNLEPYSYNVTASATHAYKTTYQNMTGNYSESTGSTKWLLKTYLPQTHVAKSTALFSPAATCPYSSALPSFEFFLCRRDSTTGKACLLLAIFSKHESSADGWNELMTCLCLHSFFFSVYIVTLRFTQHSSRHLTCLKTDRHQDFIRPVSHSVACNKSVRWRLYVAY